MNDTLQNIIHAALAVAIAAVLWSLQPVTELNTHGILLTAHDTVLPPISPAQVQVYQTAPPYYTSVGLIRTSRHFDSVNPQAMQQSFQTSIDYAKQLAANAGANGILIAAAGANTGQVSPLDGFVVYGQAITVH